MKYSEFLDFFFLMLHVNFVGRNTKSFSNLIDYCLTRSMTDDVALLPCDSSHIVPLTPVVHSVKVSPRLNQRAMPSVISSSSGLSSSSSGVYVCPKTKVSYF